MLRRGLMLRVALIFGGESHEHEVSVASALRILDNHDPDEVELRLFAVSKDGSWPVSYTHLTLPTNREV